MLDIIVKTYPEYTDNMLQSFQIDNYLCGRNRATKIVESIPGVVINRRPKRLFSWFREDVFCEFEFELDGVKYQIEEPFGDNSMYWIGPYQEETDTSFEKVLEVFNVA